MADKQASKTFINRFLAYALTRVSYRDTEALEDYHSISGQLNMDFYSKMLQVVQAGYEKYIGLTVSALHDDKPKNQESQDFEYWLKALLLGMNQWLPAQTVRDRFSGTVAEYVLSGEFLSACTQGKKLNDELMKRLNIDVHNRFYTLVCKGIISIDPSPYYQ